jgi:hypothetical protein
MGWGNIEAGLKSTELHPGLFGFLGAVGTVPKFRERL